MARRKPETACPSAKFQQMISGKYKLRILWSLKDGPLRYGEIKNGLLVGSEATPEIAPRVLSRELKTLVQTGMIDRKDYKVVPPKVEYKLTATGRTFLPVIDVIRKWGMRHFV
jgi:DNA-binding HxlR family transcriptional regulator